MECIWPSLKQNMRKVRVCDGCDTWHWIQFQIGVRYLLLTVSTATCYRHSHTIYLVFLGNVFNCTHLQVRRNKVLEWWKQHFCSAHHSYHFHLNVSLLFCKAVWWPDCLLYWCLCHFITFHCDTKKISKKYFICTKRRETNKKNSSSSTFPYLNIYIIHTPYPFIAL